MDFLQTAVSQIVQLVKSMSPGARVTAAASLAAVAIGAAWIANHRPEGPHSYLMGGQSFSAAQLGNMEAAFGKAGLNDYLRDGDRVRVSRGQQSKYMAALADAGALPQNSGEYLRQAVDSNNFMVSGSRQQTKIRIALQSELQLAVRRMPGVKDSTVLIGEETTHGFPPVKTVTASVSIEPEGPSTVDEATVAAIRSFVANAWGGGLKPENVTVVRQDPRNNDPTSAQLSPSPTPAEGEEALAWLNRNAIELGLGGLILAGLLMALLSLRPISRPPASPMPAAEAVHESLLASYEESPQPSVGRIANDAVGPSAAAGEGLREELAVMIRRDPQSAAGVLRTWIGNTS